MILIVNGVEQELEAATVLDVARCFGLEGKPVLVEAGGIVVERENWGRTAVRNGMEIEIVHFVGGG